MVIDLKNHRRLAVMNALRPTFQPEAFPAGVDLMKHVRAKQPDVVLLFMGRFRHAKALKSCRWMKTDVRPVRWVVLVNIDGAHQDPEKVMSLYEADGYWEGPATPEQLCELTQHVVAGEKPAIVGSAGGSFFTRLLGR